MIKTRQKWKGKKYRNSSQNQGSKESWGSKHVKNLRSPVTSISAKNDPFANLKQGKNLSLKPVCPSNKPSSLIGSPKLPKSQLSIRTDTNCLDLKPNKHSSSAYRLNFKMIFSPRNLGSPSPNLDYPSSNTPFNLDYPSSKTPVALSRLKKRDSRRPIENTKSSKKNFLKQGVIVSPKSNPNRRNNFCHITPSVIDYEEKIDAPQEMSFGNSSTKPNSHYFY